MYSTTSWPYKEYQLDWIMTPQSRTSSGVSVTFIVDTSNLYIRKDPFEILLMSKRGFYYANLTEVSGFIFALLLMCRIFWENNIKLMSRKMYINYRYLMLFPFRSCPTLVLHFHHLFLKTFPTKIAIWKNFPKPCIANTKQYTPLLIHKQLTNDCFVNYWYFI